MKKAIQVIGLCCIVIVIAIGIYMAISPKTLDFRGTVTKIETVDGNTVFYIAMAEASYTVTADRKTEVSYCCADDPDIELSDIKVGDTIEGDYRLLSNNVARFMTVAYHN